jgi:hypothetical protein
VHLGYGTNVWLSVSKCDVSLCSVVKQRLKCNTGKVCKCLIQFLLTQSCVDARGRNFLTSFVSAQRLTARTVG